MISTRSSQPRSTRAGSPIWEDSASMSSSRISGTSKPSGRSGVTLDTKASLGLVLDDTLSTKSALLRRSIGTTAAPARMQPKKASTHCGQLGPHRRTRSPFPTPLLWSRLATRPAPSQRSWYDHVRYLNPGLKYRAGRVPKALALASRNSTRVSPSSRHSALGAVTSTIACLSRARL